MTFQPLSVGFCTRWLALAAGILCLQGCNNNAPTASSTRVFAADVTGAAKTCSAPKPSLKDGEVTEVPMTVGNDGGWCGITVANDGKPYRAGLVNGRPAHGKVFIHEVGDVTRIDYTPDKGFKGSDNFSVKLIPGNPGIHATVTVNP